MRALDSGVGFVLILRCNTRSRRLIFVLGEEIIIQGDSVGAACVSQYEDAADELESSAQPAPPPPANNASTFPALGSAGGNGAAEPAKAPPPSAPQLLPSDPAVLQMGPTAGSQSTTAGAVRRLLSLSFSVVWGWILYQQDPCACNGY